MGKAYCWWMKYVNSMDAMYIGNRFRTVEIKPDWHYADALQLQDYAALGGVGVPICDLPAFTLTTSATNGVVDPAGGNFASNSILQLTATANLGYAFSSWSGDLSGTVNPTNLTMNTNKSVTANFVSAPTYTLATNAPNGSITLNPPGGVYNSNTVVTVTAIPNAGYGFTNWSGHLGGSLNPTTITMNDNKSVTANFIVASGEPLPWIEDFNGLPAGTTNQGWPTTWTATRTNGTFKVANNRLQVNQAPGVEGVFTTGVINIAGRTVNLSVSVESAGVDTSDYARLYIKTNGGPETLIRQVSGTQSVTNWTRNGITGTNLQIIIRTRVSFGDEYYYFDNLIVSNAPALSPSVSITQPASNAVFAPGANLLLTATASDPDGSVAKVEYFVAGNTKIGESTTGPAFGFTWPNAPAGRHNLTAKATDNLGLTGLSAVVPLTIRTWLQSSPQPGGQIQIQWAGGGMLQTATNVLGPWNDVSGAVSPHLTPTTNAAQFFRVKQW
jgi:hypothetical protein